MIDRNQRARELYRALTGAIEVIEEAKALIADQARRLKALPVEADEMRLVDCRSCGVKIGFVKVASSNKSHPVNPGLLTVVTADGSTAKGRVSHFATCPNADKHRRVSK